MCWLDIYTEYFHTDYVVIYTLKKFSYFVVKMCDPRLQFSYMALFS